ncbi:MAG: hypothetical protein SF051_14290 [Elusimicrobiota bacterium]|nr:hypothetical protein [Elusimicrobiota bacterium]
MSTRPLLLTTAAALLLAGCVAETVERRRPRKGPVKEVGFVDFGGGRVRYSTEGWGWFVAGRRRHAKRLMRKNCGRELVATIVDEYTREDADIAYSGDDVTQSLDRGLDHYKIAPFQHYAYECRPKGGVAPAVAPSTAAATSPFVVVPARELLPGATVPAPAPAPEPAPAPSSAPEPAAVPPVAQPDPVVSTAPAVTEPAP